MSRHPSIITEAAASETSTLEYLVERGSVISNESRSLAFVDSIKSTFYDFVSRLTGFISSLKVGNFKGRKLDASEVVTKVVEKPYQESRNLYVNVQPGFTGKWVDYLTYLHTVILPSVSSTDATLEMTIKRLAILLSEPDRLKAQSGIKDLDRSIVVVDQNQLEKMKSYIKHGSKTQLRLSDVLDRNADLATSYDLINKINAELAEVDFVSIQSRLTRLAELTTALQNTMKDEESRDLSGLVTSQLSELFFKLGVSLTAGAVLMDAVTMQTVAMDNSLTSLKEQLK